MSLAKKSMLVIVCLVIASSVAILGLERNTKLQLSYWFSDRFDNDATRTLFVGSSSIARLPLGLTPSCAPSAKRGFGNGMIADVRRYLEAAPLASVDKLILYIGENDIANGEPVADVIYELDAIIMWLQSEYDVKLAVLNIKPSPLRSQFHEQFLMFNEALNTSLDAHPNIRLIPFHSISNAGLYERDGIHLNRRGYERLASWIEDFCSMSVEPEA